MDKSWRIQIIYIFGFLDLLSVSICYPLLPKMAVIRGASPTVAGLIGSLYGGLQILSSTPMGSVSDVHGRKFGLLLSYVIPAVGYLIGGTTTTVFGLCLSRLAPGCFKHGLTISKALLADVATSEERPAVFGLFTAFSNAGFIVGPLIGGYLAEMDPSLTLPMTVTGICFLLQALLVQLVLSETPRDHHKLKNTKPNFTQEHENGDSLVSEECPRNQTACTSQNNTTARQQWSPKTSISGWVSKINIFHGVSWQEQGDLIIERLFLTLAMLSFRQNLPQFLQEHFNVDYITMGKILSFNGAVATIAALSVGRVTKLYNQCLPLLMTHATLLLFTVVLLITLSPSLTLTILLLAPLSLATSTLRIVQVDIALSRGKATERGMLVGLQNAVASLSRTVSPLLVGVLQEVNYELPGFAASGLALGAFVTMVTMPSLAKQTSDFH